MAEAGPVNTLINDLVVDVSRLFNQEFTARLNRGDSQIQANSKRIAGVLFQPTSTGSVTYNTAKSYLKQQGADDEAAAAFAVLVLNLSKVTGKSPQMILREVDRNGVGFTDSNFKLLNRIRNRMSQIANYDAVNNCLSFNENIKYYYLNCKPFSPFFVSSPVTEVSGEVLYSYFIETDDIDPLDVLRITADTSLPSWLTLSDNGDRTALLTGTPSSSDAGVYNITLKVTDSTNLFALQEFTITVSVNQAPQFDSSPVTTVIHDVGYTYNIDTSDPDVGDVLTITADSVLPGWLTLVDNGDTTAVLSGTPTVGDIGTVSITLRVEDQLGAFATQTFDIEVTNSPPQFDSSPVITGDESVLYTYNIVTSDPDPVETLTITADIIPAWLSLVDNGDGTGTLSGTPASGDVGVNTVTLRVTDSGGLFALQNFDITVSAASVSTVPYFFIPPDGDGEPVAYLEHNTSTDVLSSPQTLLECPAPHTPTALSKNDDFIVSSSQGNSFSVDVVLRAYEYDGSNYVLTNNNLPNWQGANGMYLDTDNNVYVLADVSGSGFSLVKLEADNNFNELDTVPVTTSAYNGEYIVVDDTYVYICGEDIFSYDKATLTLQDQDTVRAGVGDVLGLSIDSSYLYVYTYDNINNNELKAYTTGSTLTQVGSTFSLDSSLTNDVSSMWANDSYIWLCGADSGNPCVYVYEFNGSTFTELARLSSATYGNLISIAPISNDKVIVGSLNDNVYIFSFDGVSTITLESTTDLSAFSLSHNDTAVYGQISTNSSASSITDTCPSVTVYYT